MPRPSRPRPVAGQRARARTHGGTAPPAELPGRRTAVIERPPAAAGDVERVPAPEPRDPRRTAARAAWSGDWLGGSGRARAALAALLVLALVALVALGLVALRVRAADRVEVARDQAQAAANAQVVDILSYDYRHLDKDFAKGRAALTGRFAGDYAETTAKVIKPSAEQYKAVVKAEVAASSVVSASSHRVAVLLFVNQTTTSTRLDGPKVDLNRVRLTMDEVDGRWLVSDVRAL